MKPTKIKIIDNNLSINWSNNSASVISLKYLRDECPCASCKGETILWRTYKPSSLPVFHAEMYKIENLQMVGGYAIQISWKDGHNTVIYSWEYLLLLDKDQESGINHKYEPIK